MASDGHPAPRHGFIVVAVNGSSSGRSLIRYIEGIARFRHVDDKVPDDPEQFRSFYQEPRGWRVSEGPGVVAYLSRHGAVVDALRIWRARRGLESPKRRIVKNVYIDMGVMDARDSLTELYEVKTSAARSDVYTGIGQLMVHGAPGCERCLVLPANEDLKPDLADALERLEIGLLQFRLDGKDGEIFEESARGERA